MIRFKSHLKNIFRIRPEQGRMNVLRMDKNEFVPYWPENWFQEALSLIKPEHISIHPEIGPLYEKIEKVLGFSKENVVITAGSDAAIRSAFDVFVEPGDEVVIPSPTFAMYYIYAQIYRAGLVQVDYNVGPSIDENALLHAITPKTRLIAIANPNSPTGTVMERDSLLRIIDKASGYGAAVLIDEAYYPFYEESISDLIGICDNLMVTRTFSKAAGMAGLRAGFLLSNSDVARAVFAVKPMYEITGISALLAEYVLDHYDRVSAYATNVRKGKKLLADYFIGRGFEVFTGYANFLHVDFGKRKQDIISHLKRHGVFFKEHFEHPSLKRFSRFTVGPEVFIKEFINVFDGMR